MRLPKLMSRLDLKSIKGILLFKGIILTEYYDYHYSYPGPSMTIASTTTTTRYNRYYHYYRPPLANHVLPLPLATTMAITVILPARVPMELNTALDW